MGGLEFDAREDAEGDVPVSVERVGLEGADRDVVDVREALETRREACLSHTPRVVVVDLHRAVSLHVGRVIRAALVQELEQGIGVGSLKRPLDIAVGPLEDDVPKAVGDWKDENVGVLWVLGPSPLGGSWFGRDLYLGGGVLDDRLEDRELLHGSPLGESGPRGRWGEGHLEAKLRTNIDMCGTHSETRGGCPAHRIHTPPRGGPPSQGRQRAKASSSRRQALGRGVGGDKSPLTYKAGKRNLTVPSAPHSLPPPRTRHQTRLRSGTMDRSTPNNSFGMVWGVGAWRRLWSSGITFDTPAMCVRETNSTENSTRSRASSACLGQWCVGH